MHRIVRRLALIGVFALGAAEAAHGAFIASLAVDVSPATGGYYAYIYTLTNASTSTLPAVQFDLAVDVAADLQNIVAPTGWAVDYESGLESVSFYADSLGASIVPGSSAVLSFLSRLGPALQAYDLVGSSPPILQVLDGEIAAPSAVPEPSSWTLLAASSLLASAGGIRRFRRLRS